MVGHYICTYYCATLIEVKSRYFLTALNGTVELPAFVLTTVLMTKFTRLRTMCGFMLAGAVILLVTTITAPISPVSNPCSVRTVLTDGFYLVLRPKIIMKNNEVKLDVASFGIT